MDRLFWTLLIVGLFWWCGPLVAIAVAVFVVEVVFEGNPMA